MNKSSTKQTKLTDEEADKLTQCQNAIAMAYHHRHGASSDLHFFEAVRLIKECNPKWGKELCEGFIYDEFARCLAMEYTLNHPAPDIKPTTNKTADA